jgi:hypothetical protein
MGVVIAICDYFFYFPTEYMDLMSWFAMSGVDGRHASQANPAVASKKP